MGGCIIAERILLLFRSIFFNFIGMRLRCRDKRSLSGMCARVCNIFPSIFGRRRRCLSIRVRQFSRGSIAALPQIAF